MATEFKIPLHRFDTNLLPPEARQVGTEAFNHFFKFRVKFKRQVCSEHNWCMTFSSYMCIWN